MPDYELADSVIVELTRKTSELDAKAVIYQFSRSQISKGSAFFKFSDIEKRRDELLEKADKIKTV